MSDPVPRELHATINRLDQEIFELRRRVGALEKDVRYCLDLGFPLRDEETAEKA